MMRFDRCLGDAFGWRRVWMATRPCGLGRTARPSTHPDTKRRRFVVHALAQGPDGLNSTCQGHGPLVLFEGWSRSDALEVAIVHSSASEPEPSLVFVFVARTWPKRPESDRAKAPSQADDMVLVCNRFVSVGHTKTYEHHLSSPFALIRPLSTQNRTSEPR